MEQIKNGVLTVEIAEHGAELQSIKDADGQEYLWDGDAQYWGRKSPILFPIVCGLWKNTFRINGKEYHMERHGFARDTRSEEHTSELQSRQYLVCRLLLEKKKTEL